MSDEIIIEPKQPTNPAGKPGVGGLAAIPGVIGTIVGADDFCSVWNFPLSAVCIQDPAAPGEKGMPAWCAFSPTGVLCPGTEPVKNEETGLNWSNNHCFDSDWKSIPCLVSSDILYCSDGNLVPNYATKNGTCNSLASCFSLDGFPVDCDILPNGIFIEHVNGTLISTSHTAFGRCAMWSDSLGYPGPLTYKLGDCIKRVTIGSNGDGVADKYQFDEYMRVNNYYTGVPVTNDEYEGGYPMNAVYPPPPPVPVPVPFDPGPNPFNPTLPVVPDGEECAGIVCECIALVVNALGAVNNTLLKIDESVLSVVSAVQNKVIEFPQGEEVEPVETVPFDDKPILDKLTDILKSIDDISVEVTKEAGTNFWDVLGGAFGDIFDLIEFLIEKVIYLVVPEDTSNINEAFETLNGLISTKMKPVEQVKTAIDGAMNVEAKTFEDIYITLPTYGEVKFFETDYIQIALPYVRRILSAMMILMTAFYAYRKVSSEMIR